LEATSTPRVGVMATISTGSLASARATVTFCWLPPDSSRTGWPSPADTRDSRRASGAARASRRLGPTKPKRAIRSVIVIEMFSAVPSSGTNPSACWSSGM
jgi:hypothetical protein